MTYKFTIRVLLHGPMSVVSTQVTLSSCGKTEEEAYRRLYNNLSILNVVKLYSDQVIKFDN